MVYLAFQQLLKRFQFFERILADANDFQWVLARSASSDGSDVDMWAEISLSVDKGLPRSASG